MDWYISFLDIHKDELSPRLSQVIKECRAKINSPTINRYLDNLTVAIENIDPAAIVNYNETNFSDDASRSKVVVLRSTKRAELWIYRNLHHL